MKIQINTVEQYDTHCRSLFKSMGARILAGTEPDELVIAPEVSAALAKRDAQRAEKQNAEIILSLQQDWGAPKRQAQCAADFNGKWGESYSALEARLGTGMMVALVGGRGTGKTQMAVELMRAKTRQMKAAFFCSAMQFFMDIKNTYKDASKEDEAAIIKRYQTPSLLVIDEIGKRGGSDWENNLLFELLNRRYNDMRDTVLIDNRSKVEFIETIGPSLASRMNECGGILECNWESFR